MDLKKAALIAVAVVAVLIAGIVGFKTVVARPATVGGIGPDGKPMTQQQIDDLATRMSGGRYQPPQNR